MMLETYPCPPSVKEIVLTTDEVTTICPILDNPDFYTVEITYIPTETMLDTKSLKKYLQQFREEGFSCEGFTQRIINDLSATLNPQRMKVVVTQKPRGGIGIKATATYPLSIY